MKKGEKKTKRYDTIKRLNTVATKPGNTASKAHWLADSILIDYLIALGETAVVNAYQKVQPKAEYGKAEYGKAKYGET